MCSQPSVPPAVRSANIYANLWPSCYKPRVDQTDDAEPVPETRIRNANADGTSQ